MRPSTRRLRAPLEIELTTPSPRHEAALIGIRLRRWASSCNLRKLFKDGSRECCVRAASEHVKLTILYDDDEYDERLIAAHGFACLIEAGNQKVLFDTGGDPSVLFYNMGVLGVHPRSLSSVVISHNHWDHTGGLSALLARNPALRVVMPGSASAEALPVGVDVVGPFEVNYKGTLIREQALAILSSSGIVIVVGCSHPGVERIVEEAVRKLQGKRVVAVIGGLHLLESSIERIKATAESLRRMGVERVAACHCTGRRSLDIISEVHGGVERCGAGAVLSF